MALSLDDHLSEPGIDKWIAQLGVTNARVPRDNVRTAVRFFRMQMATLEPTMALNFIRAMDLSRPVRAVTLAPNDRVIAFRVGTESPYKLFYTRPGASPYNTGINPAGRTITRFRVRTHAPALESYATGAIDVWTFPAEEQRLTLAVRSNSTGYMAAGGGIQLIVPRSYASLEVT